MSFWVLLIFNCADMNSCLAKKEYFDTQKQCEAKALQVEDRLVGQDYVLICRNIGD